MVYIHKDLFLLILHVHLHSALTPFQIFILGLRLKQLPYLGYAGLVAKKKNNDETMWKLLKALQVAHVNFIHILLAEARHMAKLEISGARNIMFW